MQPTPTVLAKHQICTNAKLKGMPGRMVLTSVGLSVGVQLLEELTPVMSKCQDFTCNHDT